MDKKEKSVFFQLLDNVRSKLARILIFTVVISLAVACGVTAMNKEVRLYEASSSYIVLEQDDIAVLAQAMAGDSEALQPNSGRTEKAAECSEYSELISNIVHSDAVYEKVQADSGITLTKEQYDTVVSVDCSSNGAMFLYARHTDPQACFKIYEALNENAAEAVSQFCGFRLVNTTSAKEASVWSSGSGDSVNPQTVAAIVGQGSYSRSAKEFMLQAVKPFAFTAVGVFILLLLVYGVICRPQNRE